MSARAKPQSTGLEQHKSFSFREPRRSILESKDMQTWQTSSAFRDVLGFIEQLSKSVEEKRISATSHISPNVEAVCKLLDTLESWIEKHPPDRNNSQRFGNKSFRKWENELRQQADALMRGILPDNIHAAIIELKSYLVEGFGNSTRIDYGSGHELSFIVWILCLCKLGFLEPTDSDAIVLVIFRRYLEICQNLQRTYNLEPAGSHGVWGIDDYQFLPFYFGSAQLIGSGTIPSMCLDTKFIEKEGDEYLYLRAIRFIMEVKSGPFFEHSRQLYDISGVSCWEKVNTGLGKMYRVEVLGKFPVVQHLVFGSLFSISSE